MTSGRNNLLAICIPTYNHAEPLRKCLEAMIPQASKRSIPIYISDNASTDNTAQIIKTFQKTYQYLYYKSNKENLGVDQNMINAAHMASTEYVWVIGARRILLPDMLEKVYSILNENDLDLLILNDLTNIFSVPESQIYDSAQKIFLELNRNLTGLGFQILPAQAWKLESIAKYAETEWTIVGLTLEFIAQKPNLKAYFLAEAVAMSSGMSHWRPKFFQIWTNWKKTIDYLPPFYPDKDKELVIRNSVRYLFVSSPFVLMELRAERIFNAQAFKVYREDIKHYANISPSIAYVISRFPIKAFIFYFEIYAILRGIMRKFIHQEVPINPTRKTDIPYL